MITTILARLVPFKTYLLMGGALALSGAIAVQTVRLNAAQGDYAAETAAHALTRANALAQEVAIATLRAQDEALRLAAAEADARARVVEVKTVERVRYIKAQPVPQTCPAAIAFLVKDAAGDTQ